MHSSPLDQKWCLGVLRSIFKCSACKKDAKLVYRAWMHYFGVPKLGKWFRTICIHCTALDPKWFLQVFWNIRQPSACEKMQNLCLGRKCIILGYRSCENHFLPNASTLIPWTYIYVWECFGALWKDFECTIAKLVYQAWMHYFGYRSSENGFAPNVSIILLWTQNDFCECLGTFVNIPHVKRCKPCVSGVNALFRGTEIAKIISHQMHSV
jgi:hypothetical protein